MLNKYKPHLRFSAPLPVTWSDAVLSSVDTELKTGRGSGWFDAMDLPANANTAELVSCANEM